METVKKIILQKGVVYTEDDTTKVAFVIEGNNVESLNKKTVSYDDLTQAEKDQWDAFYEMIKSKV